MHIKGSGISGVSREWQVGQMPWVPLEGGGAGHHSTGLFLTYATQLTFLMVWLGTCKTNSKEICFKLPTDKQTSVKS